MKRIYLLLFISWMMLLSSSNTLKAQVLNVPEIIQEQSEWCWSATTKCILQYYGHTHTQCEIANYTRTVATWHSFGTTDCCIDPTLGCNYWNYNYGATGSQEEILNHFGNLITNNLNTSISLSQIQTEISGGRPFLLRWGWTSGGGHFMVGYGIASNNIYYMNPLPGYGYEISDYNWMLGDGTHTWTHTQTLHFATDVNTIPTANSLVHVTPNPCVHSISVDAEQLGKVDFSLYDITGKQLLFQTISSKTSINTEQLANGLYWYDVRNGSGNIQKGTLIKQDE